MRIMVRIYLQRKRVEEAEIKKEQWKMRLNQLKKQDDYGILMKNSINYGRILSFNPTNRILPRFVDGPESSNRRLVKSNRGSQRDSIQEEGKLNRNDTITEDDEEQK